MKSQQRFLSIFVIFYLFLASTFAQNIPPCPSPPRLVNDFASILSPQQVADLERSLVAYNDSTSSQVTVVVLQSIDIYPIEDVALKIGKEWGIGQKGKNNGVLLLIAMAERKSYIATGYGMEGVLPDMVCKRIIDQELKPRFKQQQYYEGIKGVAEAIQKAAADEYKADPNEEELSDGAVVLILIVIIIVFIVFAYYFDKNGDSGNYGTRHRSYQNNNTGFFFTGGDGGSGGGSSSDSGGFGGFGGGDFGGGGAGGDW